MEKEESMSCLKEPSTGSYTVPKNPAHILPPCNFNIHFNIILLFIIPDLSEFFSSGIRVKNLYALSNLSCNDHFNTRNTW